MLNTSHVVERKDTMMTVFGGGWKAVIGAAVEATEDAVGTQIFYAAFTMKHVPVVITGTVDGLVNLSGGAEYIKTSVGTVYKLELHCTYC